MLAPPNGRRSMDVFTQATDQVLTNLHEFNVRGVRLIEFKHCKLGIVERTHAFISKITIDFEHALKPTYDQSLQIKFLAQFSDRGPHPVRCGA